MRVVAIVLGCLLLVGGGAVVAIADHERQTVLEQLDQRLEKAEQRLADAEQLNVGIAETLTGLRSTIADQDSQLSDATGFIR